MPVTDEIEERVARVETGIPIPHASGEWRNASIQERMERYGVPGVSVAVLHDGRIAWARGYGVRDVGTGDPVSAETRFQAASISKPIAALAALRLADRGEIDLDRDVNTLLHSWQVPFDEGVSRDEPVTLRRLVSHSAGLTVHGFPGYPRDAEIPSLIQILNGEPPANTGPIRVDTPPGTLVRYSGGGYCVLQQLLIELTGEDFPTLMRRLVCEPAGMTRSDYVQPQPEERWAELATGYRDGGTPVDGSWYIHPEMAAAGLWTTPSDLLRAAIAVQQAHAGAPKALLSPEMTRQLFTPQVTGEVGLGFFLNGGGSALRFGHGGANQGFRCELVAYADSGTGAAVMTNANNGGYLAYELLGSIANACGWEDFRSRKTIAAVPPAILESYAGEYTFQPPDEGAPPVMARAALADGALSFSLEGGSPLDLFPESETRFFTGGSDAELEFVRTGGEVSGLMMKLSLFEIEMSRVR